MSTQKIAVKQRFKSLNDYMLGKIDCLEIGNGYCSIEDEFKAYLKMYDHELTSEGYRLL